MRLMLWVSSKVDNLLGQRGVVLLPRVFQHVHPIDGHLGHVALTGCLGALLYAWLSISDRERRGVAARDLLLILAAAWRYSARQRGHLTCRAGT